jgi:hypothetical protein
MIAPTVMRIRDGEPLPRDLRAPPPPPPELSPRSRTEGIVQAILTWLDGQL